MSIFKTAAAAVAVAQNVPFPGARQERIATAVLEAVEAARTITSANQLDDLSVDSLVLSFEDPDTDPDLHLKREDGSWSLVGDHHGKSWTLRSNDFDLSGLRSTVTVVRFGNGS